MGKGAPTALDVSRLTQHHVSAFTVLEVEQARANH